MIYIIGPLNPVALFSIVIITAQLDFKLMRYQWTAASRTLLRTQNLTVLATSSTEATLTKAQGWRVRITAFHVPSISFWKAFLSSDLRMTLPVRIAFNEEKSAILIKPPAETYLRVRGAESTRRYKFRPNLLWRHGQRISREGECVREGGDNVDHIRP